MAGRSIWDAWRLIVIVALFAPARAESQVQDRWRVLTTTRTGLVVFDTATVDRTGPRTYEAWLRFDADPDDSVHNAAYRLVPYSYTLARYGLDCARRRIALISNAYYDSIGTVLAGGPTDSLRWQLVIPESRGEAFQQAFCNAIDGRERNRVWLVPDLGLEAFTSHLVRIQSTVQLEIMIGVNARHEIVFDTTGLSLRQVRAIAEFADSASLSHVGYGLGDRVTLPLLPPGRYRIYCASHMPFRLPSLYLDVAPVTPPTAPRRPGSPRRP